MLPFLLSFRKFQGFGELRAKNHGQRSNTHIFLNYYFFLPVSCVYIYLQRFSLFQLKLNIISCNGHLCSHPSCFAVTMKCYICIYYKGPRLFYKYFIYLIFKSVNILTSPFKKLASSINIVLVFFFR